MTMNGTDISAFQPGSPNLGSNRFGWCKVTEGVGWEAPAWRQQIASLRAAHDGAGYYHFANGLNTATAEAEYFWNAIKDTWQPGEPVALDAEGDFFTHTADPVGWCLAFAIVLKNLSGLTVVLYSDWQHIKSSNWNWQPLVDFGCGLWGAAYNSTGFGDPSPWPVIFCWQDSDRDESSGGDDDVCYGDLSTWQAYGTPQGEQDMAITQDDANLIAKTILNAGVEWFGYDGKPQPAGGRQSTSLGVFLGYSDANVNKVTAAVGAVVGAINGHTDAAVKGIPATPPIVLSDAQVTQLAELLIAKLPPAQIAALADQLKK